MKTFWSVERLDSATVLIAESNLGQFARMITDAEFKHIHDPVWLFWSAILDLRYAALGHSKSQADIYELLEWLK
jgi:hypothetical protein